MGQIWPTIQQAVTYSFSRSPGGYGNGAATLFSKVHPYHRLVHILSTERPPYLEAAKWKKRRTFLFFNANAPISIAGRHRQCSISRQEVGESEATLLLRADVRRRADGRLWGVRIVPEKTTPLERYQRISRASSNLPET